MIHGTSVVWLPVSDLQRSLTFYRDTLGLGEIRAEGDWAELDANGLRLGLNASEDPRGDGGAIIAFQPEGGVDGAVEELRSNGVEVPGDVSDHPWGRLATFKDPDGNDLQVYEPPSS
jgi:catechol 2,3-dioxygenase-like lactoylglutathione lyase family enzyme